VSSPLPDLARGLILLGCGALTYHLGFLRGKLVATRQFLEVLRAERDLRRTFSPIPDRRRGGS